MAESQKHVWCINAIYRINDTKLIWSLCCIMGINPTTYTYYICSFTANIEVQFIVSPAAYCCKFVAFIMHCAKLIKHTLFNKRDTNGNRSCQPLTTPNSLSRVPETFVLQSLITKAVVWSTNEINPQFTRGIILTS